MKNCFIYKLSRKKRFKLAIAFTVLNLVQVFLGILTTGWSIYICLSVSKHLYSEKAEITFVFTVTGMYGTHVIFEYLVGIKICEKCFARAHKRSTKRHLYAWLAMCCNTIINIFILATMSVKISKHIVRSIRHSMEKGMRNYLKDPIWKHTIDRWQFNLRCCGVNEYKDWYDLSWLDKYHMDVHHPTVQSLLLSKDHLHLPVLPWSCCDYTFPMQCFHDPIQQVEYAHLWKEQPLLIEESINNRGCIDVLRKPIESALVGFIIIAIILLINQIIIIIVSRLLYTSCRNAVILRNTFGSSPGWLFGRDCFSPVKGRTVSEIMLDLNNGAPSEEPIQRKGILTERNSRSSSIKKKKKKIRMSSSKGSAHDPVSSGEEDALMLR